MKSNEIVRKLIENERMADETKTMKHWAHELGKETPSVVTQRLRGNGLSVKTLVKFCWLLGYRVVVEPKSEEPIKDGCFLVDDDLDIFKSDYFMRKAKELEKKSPL